MTKKYPSDQSLITALRERNDDAFEQFYSDNLRVIVWLINVYKLNRDDATVTYHDGLMVVYETIHNTRFNNLSGTLSTYLHSVCRYKCLELFRKNNREKDFFDINDPMVDSQLIKSGFFSEENDNNQDRNQYLPKILLGIDQLGEPCRTLLIGYYYEGLTLAQLVELINKDKNPPILKDVNHAKVTLYRCRQKIRDILGL